jgi:16S rRNA (adenine1518-N6/adenine1519-N6)-dimethyltransferase
VKLSEMREVLSAREIRLTKSLGQNFLHDGNQLRRIVDAAELTKQDKVLEIGPGLGPLTELLLENAGEVLAIEKDGRLVEILRERFGGLNLIHDDALEFLRREPRDWSNWKLVANLPYSVASPILVELAQSPKQPERLVATLQLEVARRLMAKAGDKDYGVLTLLTQLDYEPRDWFKIPASCFFPEPDVDSACVVLVRREKPLVQENQREAFVKIVKRSFSQRRKMMMKLLKVDWPLTKLERAFAELKISPQERAEKLSLEQFASLVEILAGEKMSEEIFDVVNERDEVIGHRPRSEVHRLGLKHRAAHVLVFNARGEVFLQKRSTKKDREPGKWDSSASGHVDSGEAYDACAGRELGEELGVRVTPPLERLFKLDACAETDQEFVWVYRCQSEGPFDLNADEIERGDWFAPAAVTEWMAKQPHEFASALRFIWTRLWLRS